MNQSKKKYYKNLQKLLLVGAGAGLLLLGLVSLLIPVLPGLVMIYFGLVICRSCSGRFKQWLSGNKLLSRLF